MILTKLVNNSQNKNFRKHLRNNATEFEKLLWKKIRNDQLDYRFRRQVSIGRYIVDFCCFEKKLIIEIDGVQHEDQQDYDAERTKFLESRGFRVLRFWNHDLVQNFNGVMERIYSAVHGDSLPTSL